MLVLDHFLKLFLSFYMYYFKMSVSLFYYILVIILVYLFYLLFNSDMMSRSQGVFTLLLYLHFLCYIGF